MVNTPSTVPKGTERHCTQAQMRQKVRCVRRETAEQAVRSGLRHILFAKRPESEAAAIDAYLCSLQPLPSPGFVQGGLHRPALWGKALFERGRTGHPEGPHCGLALPYDGRNPLGMSLCFEL